MERLREEPVRALDLGHRRARLETEGSVWIGRVMLRTAKRKPSAVTEPLAQSSPTGASSNVAIASAAARPCGSAVIGRWYRPRTRSGWPSSTPACASASTDAAQVPRSKPSPSSILIAMPEAAADWPRARGPGRIAMPRSASMPPFEMIRPGSAFMIEVSIRSRVPATRSGCASIASRTIVSDPASGCPRIGGRHGRGIREEGVGPRDLAQRECVRRHAAAVDARPQPRRRRPERLRDDLAIRHLGGMLVEPVVVRRPVVEPAQQQEHRVLAGAHVPDLARALAVAGEARGGERVERHALGAGRERGLAHARCAGTSPGACGRGGPRRSGCSP